MFPKFAISCRVDSSLRRGSAAHKAGGAVIFSQDRDMGSYQRWILPRLIDLAMRADRLDAYRRRTIGAASGLVLEIGVGSGQNLPLYGSAIDRVCAIDPSMELLYMARNRIAEARLPVSPIRASAEQLPSRTRSSTRSL
jgi:SAM-dependent methyltransferase